MAQAKKEGYWNDSQNNYPEYPFPEANTLAEDQAREVYALIKAKEQLAEKVGYRGSSRSRFEPETYVGSEEFETTEFHWPAGFAEHYVLKYRVRPSEEFLQFIGYV